MLEAIGEKFSIEHIELFAEYANVFSELGHLCLLVGAN